MRLNERTLWTRTARYLRHLAAFCPSTGQPNGRFHGGRINRSSWEIWAKAAMVLMAMVVVPLSAAAENAPSLNLYGLTGLIDMPSAESQPDGMIQLSTSHFGPVSRNTLTFQITPRLSGSFRYLGVRDWVKNVAAGSKIAGIDDFNTYFDRSFDLRFQLFGEGKYRPALAIGLQDFVGTGLFAGEYLVATKHLGPALKVTAGLGWGRLGTYGAIGSPLGARPPVAIGNGGNFNFGQWFRGPAAPFAGVEWAINDRWTVKAEYSSDAYGEEAGPKRRTFRRKSPLNFGLEYQASERVRIGAYAMYGSEFGVNLSFALNPKRALTPYRETAGMPIKVRPSPLLEPAAWSTAWADEPANANRLTDALRQALAADGLGVYAVRLDATLAELRLTDHKYDSRPNAIGRAARAMAATLPPSVETFRVIPMVHGMATTAVTLKRADLERLEPLPDAAEGMLALTTIEDAAKYPSPAPVAGAFPKLSWAVGPYFRPSYFDPKSPVRLETGLRATAIYQILPGFELAGSIRYPLAGNLDAARPPSNSVLPHVRTDFPLYDQKAKPGIEFLTATKFFRPGENLYARVTLGYLEPMFAGVSGEVLWKSPKSPFSFGVELNYVKQRDFNMLFGLQNYAVLTGHASIYADLGKGYTAQVDVGRYLAGDVGVTVGLDREFGNGWKIGAFATKTNVSAARFGEGSFDKGIRVTVPLTWLTGLPSQSKYSTTLRPTTRDGGARLELRDRLYEKIKSDDIASYALQWGRFWR